MEVPLERPVVVDVPAQEAPQARGLPVVRGGGVGGDAGVDRRAGVKERATSSTSTEKRLGVRCADYGSAGRGITRRCRKPSQRITFLLARAGRVLAPPLLGLRFA
jgi:hypothetical protein